MVNLEAIAAEIMKRWFGCSEPLHDVIVSCLRAHKLDAPRVVEVTGEDLRQLIYGNSDTGVDSRNITNRFASSVNVMLRARATSLDTIACRVIRRPTEKVSTLLKPKEIGFKQRDQIVVDSPVVGVKVMEVCHIEWDKAVVYRWCVPGEPWHERTETEQPREWRADDIPEGDVRMYLPDTTRYTMCAGSGRSYVANEANRLAADAILILPESL